MGFINIEYLVKNLAAKGLFMMNILMVRPFVSIFGDRAAPGENGSCEIIASVLLDKINKMPVLMKSAICLLTHLFNVSVLFWGGRFFQQLNQQNQKRMVQDIEQGNFGPFKEMLKFYQKMTLFIYYSYVH